MIPNFFAQSQIRWMFHCYKKTWVMLPIGQRDDTWQIQFNVSKCKVA